VDGKNLSRPRRAEKNQCFGKRTYITIFTKKGSHHTTPERNQQTGGGISAVGEKGDAGSAKKKKKKTSRTVFQGYKLGLDLASHWTLKATEISHAHRKEREHIEGRVKGTLKKKDPCWPDGQKDHVQFAFLR